MAVVMGVSVTHNAWQNLPKTRNFCPPTRFDFRIPVFTRYPPPDFLYLYCCAWRYRVPQPVCLPLPSGHGSNPLPDHITIWLRAQVRWNTKMTRRTGRWGIPEIWTLYLLNRSNIIVNSCGLKSICGQMSIPTNRVFLSHATASWLASLTLSHLPQYLSGVASKREIPLSFR